ncbi:MAG: ATP-binding cassette domain-containing protein [Xanthobacteraceae bacterium]
MLFEAHDVVGGYGAIRIVNGVSFTLAAGETLAVLSRSQVGKTTLLRTLIGLADRFSGSVRIEGQPIASRDPRTAARLGVTLVPDNRGVFARLTVAGKHRTGAQLRLCRDVDRCFRAVSRSDAPPRSASRDLVRRPAATSSDRPRAVPRSAAARRR